MQSLSIISVNIWQILISFANLAILTWIVKKFLFKPVKKVMDARRENIDSAYARADAAEAGEEATAVVDGAAMAAARQTTDQMISDAAREAERRGSEIETEARERAQEIRRQAEEDAVLERKKAEEDMKREIADVSAELTGKLLKREIRPEDHRELIDSFLQDLDR